MRPRREVAPWVTALLSPLFRYSASRDAYVLRLVGRRRGPVLRHRGAGVDLLHDREERFTRGEAAREHERELTGRG